MAALQVKGAGEMLLLGDKTLGCACAYTLAEAPLPGAKKPKRHVSQQGLRNVDLFESSTGYKYERFFCHRTLTGLHPRSTDCPTADDISRGVDFAARALGTLGRCLKAFFRMMVPRIQFGIGVNLFRVGGA